MTYVPDQKKPVAPTSDHGYWGRFDVTSQLPNSAGATFQEPGVDYGDTAWSDQAKVLYVCTDPTPGAAVWVPTEGAAQTVSANAFVSQTGSDATGDGTFANPYATVARALRDAPAAIAAPQIAFRVNIIPPYSGPGFIFDHPFATAAETSDAVTTDFSAITVESYFDAANTGVGDPRFVQLLGPVVSSAGATFNGHVSYTVPTGSVPNANVGRIVRVFRAGAEVGRGVLAQVDVAANDTLYIARASSTSWVPAAGDEIYICRHAVVLTSSVKLGTMEAQSRFYLLGVEVISSSFVSSLDLRGRAFVAMCRFEQGANTASVTVAPYGDLAGLRASTDLPWMTGVEPLLLSTAGGFLTKPGTLTNLFIQGSCELRGHVIDTESAAETVTAQAVFSMSQMWMLGRARATRSSLITGLTNVVFGGRPSAPVALPALDLLGSDCATNGTNWVVIYNPNGFAAGQNVVRAQRARVSNSIQVNGFYGAAALASPVHNALTFAEIRVLAGNITGPAGQDVQAGATLAAFGGIPIVDAATLTRISST
jgi:hypothetical protein